MKLAALARIVPKTDRTDSVQTMMTFRSPPEKVWGAMMFYEEIPQRPSLLLRLSLPVPIRTRGDKTTPGSIIDCLYDGGTLEKRINDVEQARSVRFEVLDQRLGLERCMTMTGGSYELRPTVEGGTLLVLTTNYRAHLWPRFFFRPIEHAIAHAVHRHILVGMRTVLEGAPALTGELAKV